jgi:hypothetical protein
LIKFPPSRTVIKHKIFSYKEEQKEIYFEAVDGLNGIANSKLLFFSCAKEKKWW